MDASTPIALRVHEYLVRINGSMVRVYCPPDGHIEVDGNAISAQLDVTVDGHGTVAVQDRRYRISFENEGEGDAEFSILVNGRRGVGTVEDRRTMLRKRVQGIQEADLTGYVVKAPMPGLVLRILVRPGMEVSKGQGLLVLEAMKMENEVKSDRAGRVESIFVKERGPVEKGQSMVSIVRHP